MKMHNNYIFLLKRKSPKNSINAQNNDDNVIIIDTPVEFRNLINETFKIRSDDWEVKKRYFQYNVSFEFLADNLKTNIAFEVFNVQGDRYMNVEVSGNTKYHCAKTLEIINAKLLDKTNKIEEQFIIILTYDAVSEFYCNKIFSRFSHFERLFRRLLFNIYTLNYGREYCEKTISKEITEKAKSIIRPKKNNKEEQYLKEFFYSLDYSDLQSLLFTQNWTSVDEEEITEFLKIHDNISLLPEAEVREFIQGIGAKSDWDRLFKSKVGITSIEEDIDYIRKQRNKVAHSKLFTSEDYKESLKTLNKLEKTINEAIKYTQDKDFLDKHSELFKVSMQKVAKIIKGFSEQIVDLSTPLKQMQMQISQIMKPVNEAMSSLPNTLRPFLESIKNCSYIMEDHEIVDVESNDEIPFKGNETEEDY